MIGRNGKRSAKQEKYKRVMEYYDRQQLKKEIDHWCAEIENKYWGLWD